MKTETKKWIVSSLVTFITAFALSILPVIDSITLESFENGAIIGVIFAGVRAGVKAFIEWAFVSKI